MTRIQHGQARYTGKGGGDSRACFVEPTFEAAVEKLRNELIQVQAGRPRTVRAGIAVLPNGQWAVML